MTKTYPSILSCLAFLFFSVLAPAREEMRLHASFYCYVDGLVIEKENITQFPALIEVGEQIFELNFMRDPLTNDNVLFLHRYENQTLTHTTYKAWPNQHNLFFEFEIVNKQVNGYCALIAYKE